MPASKEIVLPEMTETVSKEIQLNCATHSNRSDLIESIDIEQDQIQESVQSSLGSMATILYIALPRQYQQVLVERLTTPRSVQQSWPEGSHSEITDIHNTSIVRNFFQRHPHELVETLSHFRELLSQELSRQERARLDEIIVTVKVLNEFSQRISLGKDFVSKDLQSSYPMHVLSIKETIPRQIEFSGPVLENLFQRLPVINRPEPPREPIRKQTPPAEVPKVDQLFQQKIRASITNQSIEKKPSRLRLFCQRILRAIDRGVDRFAGIPLPQLKKLRQTVSPFTRAASSIGSSSTSAAMEGLDIGRRWAKKGRDSISEAVSAAREQAAQRKAEREAKKLAEIGREIRDTHIIGKSGGGAARIQASRLSSSMKSDRESKIVSNDPHFSRHLGITDSYVLTSPGGKLERFDCFLHRKEKKEGQKGLLDLFYPQRKVPSSSLARVEPDEGKTIIQYYCGGEGLASFPLHPHYKVTRLNFRDDDGKEIKGEGKWAIREGVAGGLLVSLPSGTKEVSYEVQQRGLKKKNGREGALGNIMPDLPVPHLQHEKYYLAALKELGASKSDSAQIVFQYLKQGNYIYSSDLFVAQLLRTAGKRLDELSGSLRMGTCDTFATHAVRRMRAQGIPAVISCGYLAAEDEYDHKSGHSQCCVITTEGTDVFDLTSFAEKSAAIDSSNLSLGVRNDLNRMLSNAADHEVEQIGGISRNVLLGKVEVNVEVGVIKKFFSSIFRTSRTGTPASELERIKQLQKNPLQVTIKDDKKLDAIGAAAAILAYERQFEDCILKYASQGNFQAVFNHYRSTQRPPDLFESQLKFIPPKFHYLLNYSHESKFLLFAAEVVRSDAFSIEDRTEALNQVIASTPRQYTVLRTYALSGQDFRAPVWGSSEGANLLRDLAFEGALNAFSPALQEMCLDCLFASFVTPVVKSGRIQTENIFENIPAEEAGKSLMSLEAVLSRLNPFQINEYVRGNWFTAAVLIADGVKTNFARDPELGARSQRILEAVTRTSERPEAIDYDAIYPVVSACSDSFLASLRRVIFTERSEAGLLWHRDEASRTRANLAFSTLWVKPLLSEYSRNPDQMKKLSRLEALGFGALNLAPHQSALHEAIKKHIMQTHPKPDVHLNVSFHNPEKFPASLLLAQYTENPTNRFFSQIECLAERGGANVEWIKSQWPVIDESIVARKLAKMAQLDFDDNEPVLTFDDDDHFKSKGEIPLSQSPVLVRVLLKEHSALRLAQAMTGKLDPESHSTNSLFKQLRENFPEAWDKLQNTITSSDGVTETKQLLATRIGARLCADLTPKEIYLSLGMAALHYEVQKYQHYHGGNRRLKASWLNTLRQLAKAASGQEIQAVLENSIFSDSVTKAAEFRTPLSPQAKAAGLFILYLERIARDEISKSVTHQINLDSDLLNVTQLNFFDGKGDPAVQLWQKKLQTGPQWIRTFDHEEELDVCTAALKKAQEIADRLASRLNSSARSRYQRFLSDMHGRVSSLGSSGEFHEFREHRTGDPLRMIDTKRSAKGDRLYVRRHREEEKRDVYLLIDREWLASSENDSRNRHQNPLEEFFLHLVLAEQEKVKVNLVLLGRGEPEAFKGLTTHQARKGVQFKSEDFLEDLLGEVENNHHLLELERRNKIDLDGISIFRAGLGDLTIPQDCLVIPRIHGRNRLASTPFLEELKKKGRHVLL